MNGIVKFFKNERGFGFIQGEDGSEYFIHQSKILMDGYRVLAPGQSVTFDPEQTDRGPEAINVQPGDLPAEPPKSFRDSVVTKKKGC